VSGILPAGFYYTAGGKKLEVKREEIERRFCDAGWGLDGSFEGHLLIGHDEGRVSILAHKEHWGTDNPVFELLDHEEMTTYWVDEVPTPQQATQLLRDHGQPPETWDLP
jgi:L-2-hydroxyglutarate oxidase LhgO